MDTVSNGAVAAITTGIKVKTTPTTKPNPSPKPGTSTTAKPRSTPMPNPNSKQSQRRARKVRNQFTRKEVTEDVLATYMKNLNLSDAGGPAKGGSGGPVDNFDNMNLKPELLRGIHSRGLERPAFCQQNVIMPMIQGRDTICQAQSGMGKTAAFVISVLQRLDENDPMCKALVLAPTRELAEQILAEFEGFAKYMKVKFLPCIGGSSKYYKNLAKAEAGDFHVAVGTVGRITHLLQKIQEDQDENGVRYTRPGGMNGDSIKMFVIDEADKMIMDQSFTRDIRYIFAQISGTAQLIVTSATMPSAAFDKFKYVMRKPFTFLLRNEQLTLDGIQQFHVKVGNKAGKLTTLDELFPFLRQARGIVFCNTRAGAEEVALKMKERKHQIEGMTGTMAQFARNATLKDFKSGRTPVLIASDLLGRGIDIHHVQLVINFDLPKRGAFWLGAYDLEPPKSNEEYIHRIGRAGRYGKTGIAISFVTDGEIVTEKIKTLEQFYQTQIPELPPKVGDLMNGLN